jgi:hypothetical protein
MKLTEILALPDEIIISLLVVWSNRFNIVKLDSACCSSLDRPHLLNILKHKSFAMKADSSVMLYFNRKLMFNDKQRRLLLLWLFVREVKVSEIILDPYSFRDERSLLYDIDLISVRCLAFCQFDRVTNNDFLHIINSCPNLKELSLLRVCCISDSLFENLYCLEQLKLFSFNSSSTNCSPLMLKHLASRCRNLEYFKFIFHSKACEFYCCTSVYSDYLASLLKHNQKISQLILYINDTPTEDFERLFGNIPVVDLMDVIIDNCPKIKCCNLKCIGNLNVLKVAQLCSTSKTLKYLNVVKCDYQLLRTIIYQHLTSMYKSITCINFYSSKFVDNGELNVEHLFNLVNRLTYISLKHIWNLCDSLLFIIADNNRLTLTVLVIDVCLNATWSHRGIESVLLYCKRLSKLKLNDCSHLAEDDFIQIARVTTTNLKTLIICKAIHLTTTVVLLLADNNKHLVSLHIKNCSNLNIIEIREYFAANKPNLKLYL